MAKQLVLEAKRERYDMDVRTMTVGELINFLCEFDEDMQVVLSHDRGYTFGGITEGDFQEILDVELEDCEEVEDEDY